MTVQMTVRLPDDIAAFIDDHVSKGTADSRAAMIARAVDHERAREAAEVEIRLVAELRERGESLYPELDDLYEWADRNRADLSDLD